MSPSLAWLGLAVTKKECRFQNLTLIDSARLSRDQVKTRLELRLKTEIRKKTITCGLIKEETIIWRLEIMHWLQNIHL